MLMRNTASNKPKTHTLPVAARNLFRVTPDDLDGYAVARLKARHFAHLEDGALQFIVHAANTLSNLGDKAGLGKDILSTPALYISYYLKMNRIEYYDRMTQVRRTGDYEQWISFFLQAFADSAEDAIHTIDRLTALHDKSTKLFDSLTKRQRTSVLKCFPIWNPIRL